MTRLYANRDSATAALRRLGVPKDKYDTRINKLTNGTLEVDLSPWLNDKVVETKPAPAAKVVAKKAPAKPAKPNKSPVKNPATKAPKAKPTNSIAAAVRAELAKGHSNEVAAANLIKANVLTPEKKWYVAWYRAHDLRTGK